ncbi:Peroxiredoxin 1-like protein [Dinothrombium tinctorium]|uniref:thioredoxin-dependent peroxiredoxin n=1 Tax=Dinothrombium tinctorium TaxID=1965070 RepID=A0A3S3P720_9ACAR|nr:Peroxiredoxin 1-like protein [Dinothrombium tinctorium]
MKYASRVEDTRSKGLLVPEVGKPAPDFHASAVVNGTISKIGLKDFRGKYVVLIFYYQDFFLTCPTELTEFNDNAESFRKLNCEVIACSTDSVYCHFAWINIPKESGGLGKMNIALLSDKDHRISKRYGVYDQVSGSALRSMFIIDSTGILRHVRLDDQNISRAAQETKRLIQEMQHADVSKPQADLLSIKQPSKGQERPEISRDRESKIEKDTSTLRVESSIESKGPTDLKIKQAPNLADAYTLKVVKSIDVPKSLKNGLAVIIDGRDKVEGEHIQICINNKLRISMIKKRGEKAQVVTTNDCQYEIHLNREVVNFTRDVVQIEHSKKEDEDIIAIDDIIIKRKIKENFVYLSVEMSSKINHIMNVNGKSVQIQATAGKIDETETDYIKLEEGGAKITYYRKYKE